MPAKIARADIRDELQTWDMDTTLAVREELDILGRTTTATSATH